LTIEPTNSSFSSYLDLRSTPINGTLSGLTIGKSGNVTGIKVDAVTVAGPIRIYGGSYINFASLAATGGNAITLQSSDSVTEISGGRISANELVLIKGNVFLSAVDNDIGTLTASDIGTLTYTDSNALTIGATGISASGRVYIETITGDITVSGNISTTLTGGSNHP
jgi:hypothetical protein